jgi:Holliday junction resolvase
VANPSKRKGSGFELEMMKVLQGYAIEAVKIPPSGLVAGFAGDIGAVLTRQDILINLQCRPSRRDTGPNGGNR